MRVVDHLRERLRHVRWIGGGSGGAKSTVARALAARFGVEVFSTDDAMTRHARRLTPASAPLLHAFTAMSMDERWVARTPAEMLQTFHWFAGEGFDLVVEDLLGLPPAPAVVVEGFRLLPRLVAPLLSRPDHAVWLLPTRDFRVRAFAARGSTTDIAARTSDPGRALANLLERDARFTDRLAGETGEAGWVVDGSTSLDDLVTRVVSRFGFGAAPAPRTTPGPGWSS